MDDQRGEFRFTPPNRGWIKVFGRVSEEQVSEVLRGAVDASVGLPYFLMEVDISEMEGATPEARRVSAKFFHQMPPLAFAVLGGTFAQRTIAKLVLKASEMLLKDNKQVSAFFSDHESADKWLETRAKHFETHGRFK
ncbi:hypothetical protein [Paraliomyxa miuraensis]|uniref:hypothetical protein n=1 Tax=Paraliomyxa miuraensis TaxID=376150 RepID=UPI00224D20FE|nr:hypothetical protein [Paraliomyxa miuraensis]